VPELINGKDIAKRIMLSVASELGELKASLGHIPKLVSISVGKHHDAEIYINMQQKAADEIGIEFERLKLNKNISQNELIAKIEELNKDKTATAVIVQQTLPEGIDHYRVTSHITPRKDAEGIHPYNLGKIFRRDADIVPCTPGAVMKIVDVLGTGLYGKEVVIVGHSDIVGKPLSLMMLNETATTTVCHIGTSEKGDIKAHTRRADILVVAVGKAEMVKADWVKHGAVVVDVGINKAGGKIVGDVDFNEVSKKAGAITPVPGGVGPITVSILMRNIMRAYKTQVSKP